MLLDFPVPLCLLGSLVERCAIVIVHVRWETVSIADSFLFRFLFDSLIGRYLLGGDLQLVSLR